MQRKYIAVPANPREGRDGLDVLPASPNDEATPGFFRSHWRRIPTLLWAWLALPLCFLPCIDVPCNIGRVLSQTGRQTRSGDYTLLDTWDTEQFRAAGSTNAAGQADFTGGSPLRKIC